MRNAKDQFSQRRLAIETARRLLYPAGVRLLIVIIAALVLRLGFVFVGLPLLEHRVGLRYDGDNYGAIAQSIYNGKWTDVERGPVYPLFVAACGNSLTVIRCVQLLLDVLTVLLIFRIGEKWWNARAGLFAAWLYALYPLAWWRVGFVNKEVLLTFMLTLTIFLWSRPALSGLGLAFVNLCKPSFLLLPLIRRWWPQHAEDSPSFLHRCRGYLITLAVMCAVIAPWTVRNYVLTGHLVPVGTERGGFTAYITNWWPTRGDWETNKPLWHAELDRIRAEHASLDEVEKDRMFYKLTIRNMLGDPIHTVIMLARKAWMFWFVSASGKLWLLTFLVQFVYVGLAIAGAIKQRPPAIVWTVVLYTWAIHIIAIADVRFALPVMPCVCLVASGVLCWPSIANLLKRHH